ncbi:MAG: hypothetical protein KDC44_22875 [Phaeodactylibacter sp.]|nr:hypothetical protein [Phaeodactylibacter sp.]
MNRNFNFKQFLLSALALLGVAMIGSAFLWDSGTTTASFEWVAFSAAGDIEYGRGPGCGQRGICSYDESGASHSSGEGAVFAIDANDALMLVIDRASISETDLEEQIVNGKFEVQEGGFTVSLTVMQQLGKNDARTIPEGEYSALVSEESVIINFGS